MQLASSLARRGGKFLSWLVKSGSFNSLQYFLPADAFSAIWILSKCVCDRKPHWGSYGTLPNSLAGGEGVASLLPKNSTPLLAFGFIFSPFGFEVAVLEALQIC